MTARHRIKVLLVSPLPPPSGGIATWTGRILSWPTPSDIERTHFNTAGRRLYHFTTGVTSARLYDQVRLTLRFLVLCVRVRPHVVHLTTSYDRAFLRDALFVRSARLLGAKVILNIRGGDFERFFRNSSLSRQRTILRVLRSCAVVVPITGATATFLRELGAIDVRVIPNCIDVSTERKIWNRNGCTRWLFVGWVIRSKGIDELFNALSSFPDSRLTIAGPLVRERNQRQQATDGLSHDLQKRVFHLGDLGAEQVRRLYSQHDLFVFPSHREGFPNVILEAMEAGLPIVTTEVGAIPEILRAGIDGLIVPAGDSKALVEAVRTLQNDPGLASRIAQSARERVAVLFSLEVVADTWIKLYREVGSP